MKFIVAFIILVVLSGSCSAFDTRTDTSVSVPVGSVVDDDLLAFGQEVEVAGQVNGSALAVGRNVNIENSVDGLIAAAGDSLTLSGKQEMVIGAARLVTAHSLNARNAALAGNVVDLDASSSIARDLFVAGTNVITNCRVGRDLKANGQVVKIGGNINRNVIVTAQRLTILPDTIIRGNLTYHSPNNAAIAPRARIMGIKTHLPMPRRTVGYNWGLGWIVRFIAMLAFGAVIVAIFPIWSRTTSRKIIDFPGWAALWGLVTLIVTPITILIVLVTIIGIPIAVVSGLGYIIALMLSVIVTGIATGMSILRGGSIWAQLVIGLLVVYLLSAIPIVGLFFRLLVLVFGLGGLVLAFSRRFPQPTPPPSEEMHQGSPV